MPDWREVIRGKLARVAVPRRRREELISELSNHLDDLYAELLASGISEPEASAQCLEQIDDVQQIAAAARQAQIWEDAMNQRSRTLWLPGLVTFTLSSVSLMLMQLFTFSRPRVHWVDGGAVAMACVWLVSLLPCGALGAYLSRRAGGTRWTSMIASLFPSLVMFGMFLVLLPIGVLVERNPYLIHLIHRPIYIGLPLLTWIVVPGVALLLGALPVLWTMDLRPGTPRPVA